MKQNGTKLFEYLVEMFIAVGFVVKFNTFNKSFDFSAFFGVETIDKWCDVL